MIDDDDPLRKVSIVGDFRTALLFLTRIPATAAGATDDQPLDLRRASRMFPLVGALIGAVGGFVVVLSLTIGLPVLIAAGLAVATTVALTGAFHEDGLADTADGFGGGATIARKLEIMDDSRIGTFGTVAVTFSVVLRVAALAALLPAGGLRAAAALIAVEAASRGAMVRIWRDLPAARPGGLAGRAGFPDAQAAMMAVAGSAVIVAVTVIPTFGLWAALAGVATVIAAGLGCAALFVNQIGGQTGDALGTIQQCTSIMFLIAITPFA